MIVIDAATSGATPGTIYRFDAGAQPLPNDAFRCSTHAFGVAEAIELARALARLPRSLIVYGIEGKTSPPAPGFRPKLKRPAAK